jgi:XTP/dITP diphosphohydrolase
VKPRLTLATANPDKARELRALLADTGYEVVALADHPGLVLPPEGAQSYAANARQKAVAVATGAGTVALADDSGIEVDALGGRPGVASARYGGPGLDDTGRVDRLLAELAALGDTARRTARFRCVVALAAPWADVVLAEGVLEGELARAPRGHGGFGYDPVFVVPDLGRTLAELRPEDKDRLSHRGRAIARVRPVLARWAARAARGPERAGAGGAPGG